MILRYDDKKGFGFIRTSHKDIFFHIREYRPNKTPSTNERVVFELATNKQGRLCATNVQELSFVIQKEHQRQLRNQKRQAYQDRQEQKQNTLMMVCAIAVIFMAMLGVAVLAFGVSSYVLFWYFVMEAISFVVYYLDKVATQNDNQ